MTRTRSRWSFGAFLATSVVGCSVGGLTGGGATTTDAGAHDAAASDVDATSPSGGDANVVDAASALDVTLDVARTDDANDAAGTTDAPDAAAPVDAAVCTLPKTAIVGGSSSGYFAGVRKGTGAWTLTTSPPDAGAGAAMFYAPSLAVDNEGNFVAVYAPSPYAYAYSFASGANTTWSAPALISTHVSLDAPSQLLAADQLYLIDPDPDNGEVWEDVYDDSETAWNTPAQPTFTNVSGQVGATAIDATPHLAVAYRAIGSNTSLVSQDYQNGAWSSAFQVGGTSVSTSGVTLVTPLGAAGGAHDLIAVYRSGTTNKLASVQRQPGGAWEAEATIGPDAVFDEPPAVAALPGGNFVLVARALDGHAVWSLYSTTAQSWSALAALGTNEPAGPIAVAPGVCGDDAVAAFPLASDNVQTTRLSLAASAWSANEAVTGTTGSTVVAIATLP